MDQDAIRFAASDGRFCDEFRRFALWLMPGLLLVLSACGSGPNIGCRASTYNPAIQLEDTDLTITARAIFHDTLIAEGFGSGGQGNYSRANVCSSQLIQVNTAAGNFVVLTLLFPRPFENSSDHIRMVNGIVADLRGRLNSHPKGYLMQALTVNRD